MLHILGSAGVDGTAIANMTCILAKESDPREFSISVLFLGASGPLVSTLGAAGLPAAQVAWSTTPNACGAWRFWRFLRKQRVDLLHVHFGGRAIRSLARIATDAPVVMHVHSRLRHESYQKPGPQSFKHVDAVIATSRAVADTVQAERIHVVYPGVAHGEMSKGRDRPVIGAAGRLVPLKGYERLLEAFAALHARRPDMRLEIAGDGPSRTDLERQAAQLGIDRVVTFLGWSDELPSLMARWCVFVQPSLEEALGITVLQAMAAGLPVVASAVGGLPEIVEHEVTGLLVPPGDVTALTTALDDLAREPQRRLHFGDAARQRASEFSEARFARAIADVYREVLGLTPPGGTPEDSTSD